MRARNSRRKSTRPMVIVAVVVVVNASGEYIVWANLRRQRAIDETRRRTVREGEKQRKRETEREIGGGGGRVSIVRERSRVNRLQSIRGSSWSRNGRQGVTSSGRNSENIQLACTRVCTYEEHVNVNTKRSTVCELIHVRVHVYVCTT